LKVNFTRAAGRILGNRLEANGEDSKVCSSDSIRRPGGSGVVASARGTAFEFAFGRRVHFRRTERHDRFVGSHKPPGKVAGSARFRCYRPGRRWPVGGPRKTALRGRLRCRASGRSFDLWGLSSVSANRERSAGSVCRGRLGVGGESVGYLSAALK
jgi:hypothetical protein